MRQQDLPSVRDDYLPAARTWVAERESALAGFISVLRDKVVGALFVVPAHQHAGVGWVLMALAQQAYPALTLEVYRLNRHACRFVSSPWIHPDCTAAQGGNRPSHPHHALARRRHT